MSMLVIFLGGCSKEGETETTAVEEFYDITVETQEFPAFRTFFGEDEQQYSFTYLGTQFLGEEPVQLWAHQPYGWTRVYLFRMNGEMELLLEEEKVQTEYGWDGGVIYELVCHYDWYMDRDGGFYCIYNLAQPVETLVKLDKEGTKLYSINQDSLPGELKGICQTPDGRVYISLLGVSGRVGLTLAEINPADGSFSILEEVQVDATGSYSAYMRLGSGTAGLALYGDLGIMEINPENGEITDVLQFRNTSYSTYDGNTGSLIRDAADFRIRDDESVEILQADSYGSTSLTCLKQEKIQRIPITVCAPNLEDWVKIHITQFNRENDTYFIKVEEIGAGYDMSEAAYKEALNDYIQRINIQLATGKGPDIMMGTELLEDGILDMIEKRIIEDLAPYMERNGIREEDYFPLAFDWMRDGDKIYTINPTVKIYIHEGDAKFLGLEPDIRELADTLLALEEKAVYMKGVSAGELLRLFLEGSETLWGMVDWEAGTCDFGGELFTDLLEAAGKYGDNSRNSYRSLALKNRVNNFYKAATPSEMEERGATIVGWMFDDGSHPVAEVILPIVINANSKHKEAAWEFLSLLLGKEAQETGGIFPVNREAFWGGWLEGWFEKISGIGGSWSEGQFNLVSGEWEIIATYTSEDREFIEKEKLPNFVQMLENTRYLPVRTRPLLDIICEEAESYFSGVKSAEEVIAIIENRVKLYMSEHSE